MLSISLHFGAGEGAVRYLLCSLAMLLVWFTVSTVEAADAALPSASPSPGSWIVTIGADVRAVSQYMGSDDFVVAAVPYFDARRAGSPEAFHSPRDSTGFALYDNGVFAAGPVGALIWPRRQAFNPSLNVAATYEAGAYFDYWAMPWLRTRVEGLQGFGGSTGFTANFAMDAVVPLSTALTWSGGPRTRVVTAAAESPYFSITPAQSIASGLPVFNAGGGWQSVGAGTQLKYRFNPAWASYGFVEYDKLVGSTASSPIVTEAGGSVNQWTMGVGLTYSFALSGLPF
jgi:outer membrane protein